MTDNHGSHESDGASFLRTTTAPGGVRRGTVLPRSRRTTSRAVLLAALLGVAALASCHDTPVAPKGLLQAPHSASFDLQSQSQTLGVDDPVTGAGTVYLTSVYPTKTLVTVTFSGMITQTNNASHTNVTFGPSGLPSSCGALMRIDWDSAGADSWWPSTGCAQASTSTWTSPVMVAKGTGKIFRYAYPGSCGSPPCFTYSGSQTATVDPVHGTLSLTVDHSVVKAGAPPVALSASVGSNIPAAYWGVTEWKWMPQGASPVVMCVGYGPTCYLQVTRSGTMQVTAQVNGETKTATVFIELLCNTGDSLLDNDVTLRNALHYAWDSSGYLGAPALRQEIPILVYTNPDSFHVMAAINTPCYSKLLVTPATAHVIRVHGHPLFLLDSVPASSCPEAATTGYLHPDLGPSPADAMIAARQHASSYVIDVLSVYKIDGANISVDSSLTNGAWQWQFMPLDSSWKSHVSSFSRTGPNACHLP